MSETTNKYPPEVRERAVRTVLENQGRHESRWAAIMSISAKIGCAPPTLSEWVNQPPAKSVRFTLPLADCCAIKRREFDEGVLHWDSRAKSPLPF